MPERAWTMDAVSVLIASDVRRRALAAALKPLSPRERAIVDRCDPRALRAGIRN